MFAQPVRLGRWVDRQEEVEILGAALKVRKEPPPSAPGRPGGDMGVLSCAGVMSDPGKASARRGAMLGQRT